MIPSVIEFSSSRKYPVFQEHTTPKSAGGSTLKPVSADLRVNLNAEAISQICISLLANTQNIELAFPLTSSAEPLQGVWHDFLCQHTLQPAEGCNLTGSQSQVSEHRCVFTDFVLPTSAAATLTLRPIPALIAENIISIDRLNLQVGRRLQA
jgi:hypothetical protein